MKLTKHREIILKEIQLNTNHPTAKMVLDSLLEKNHKLSFATVYNSLEYLSQKGFVKKLDLDSDSVRYDAILEPHSHFLCTLCNQLFDIPKLELSHESIEKIEFLEVESTSIILRGVCKNCKL